MAESIAAEKVNHSAQRQILCDYFRAHPFRDVPHAILVGLVGENYRSRISELRREMTIENVPVRRADGTRGYGSYVHRPNAIGRDAGTWTAAPVRLPLYDGEPGAYGTPNVAESAVDPAARARGDRSTREKGAH